MSKTTIPSGGLADAAVTSAKIADDAVTSAKSTAGITERDHFRLSSGFTGDAAPIASNLERVDTSGLFEKTGTGMTESSGVFTFPSTGKYRIDFIVRQQFSGSGQYNEGTIYYTTDTTNNSSYNLHAEGAARADNNFASSSCETFIDVTDTSNVKVKFICTNMGGGTFLKGTTSRNRTHVTFIRLGDT